MSLGLFTPSAKAVEEHRAELKLGKRLNVDLLHRAVSVTRTPEGLRAVSKERPISPTYGDGARSGSLTSRASSR